jgi:hypothetical protein
LFSEVNSSRRPINTQEINTTYRAIQQNLPCDPATVFNSSSTLVRCIDTTPVYIYTVIAQSFSSAPRLNVLNFEKLIYVLCLYYFRFYFK